MADKNNFREYQPQDSTEMVYFLEASSPRDLVSFIEKLESGQKITRQFNYSRPRDNINDITPMQRYVETLRRAGVDIGKGDARYGWKMPKPQKGDVSRDLVIFRRNN